jgi:hypothetical protein
MRDFEADITAVQDYLATEVRPGHEVTLERLHPDPIEPRLSPPYRIVHRGRPIGTASEQFREQLYRYLMTSNNYVPRNWPEWLTAVRIDAVEAVAGSMAAGDQRQPGPYGVWLVPRLVGLSGFTWDEKKKEDVTCSAPSAETRRLSPTPRSPRTRPGSSSHGVPTRSAPSPRRPSSTSTSADTAIPVTTSAEARPRFRPH